MKLVASVPVRNELGRYLIPFIEHLKEFCDAIAVVDDGSTDGTREELTVMPEVTYLATRDEGTPSFFAHEGQFRNALLKLTLACDPTHILAIDADEFVSDGKLIREVCEGPAHVFTLLMEEVWKADPDILQIRVDGGWRRRNVPILYRVPLPGRRGRDFQIANRALACGREPQSVAKQALRGGATATGASVLHFGWTREAERRARYDRYMEHDKGRFHQNAHLQSILFPDENVELQRRVWPAGLDKEAILG